MTLGHSVRLTAVVVMFTLFTSRLEAYVDPGIAGALFQAVYALVFGAIVVWVIRPWQYLKSLRHRRTRVRVKQQADQSIPDDQ